MTPVVGQSFVQSAPSVAQAAVTDVAVRATPNATIVATAVTANPSSQAVVNNRQQQAPVLERSRSSQDVATLTTAANSNAPLETPQNNQPSTPFLAQLLAQVEPEASADIAQAFTTRTTLDAETISDFSEVRYGPSYAAKPYPEPARVVEVERENVAPATPENVAAQQDIPEQPSVNESAAPVYSQLASYAAESPREFGSITFIS